MSFDNAFFALSVQVYLGQQVAPVVKNLLPVSEMQTGDAGSIPQGKKSLKNNS